jgi:hypothetical protein
MSPSALLHAYAQTFGHPPRAWQLAIRGEAWSLGDAPCAAALAHLDTGLAHLLAFLARRS